MTENEKKHKKSKCKNCNKKCSLILQLKCNSCDELFCTSCLQVQIHQCPNIDEFISNKRKFLEDNLLKNKTVSNKKTYNLTSINVTRYFVSAYTYMFIINY